MVMQSCPMKAIVWSKVAIQRRAHGWSTVHTVVLITCIVDVGSMANHPTAAVHPAPRKNCLPISAALPIKPHKTECYHTKTTGKHQTAPRATCSAHSTLQSSCTGVLTLCICVCILIDTNERNSTTGRGGQCFPQHNVKITTPR